MVRLFTAIFGVLLSKFSAPCRSTTLWWSNAPEITVVDSVVRITGTGEVTAESLTGYTENYQVTIGSGITSIGVEAFCDFGCNLQSVTFEADSQCKTIGARAFKGCSSLYTFTIPATVSQLSEGMFEGCFSLQSVTYGVSVTTIPDYCFNNCNSLYFSNIDIAWENIKVIGAYAFQNVPGTWTIPTGLTGLGEGAFAGIYNLQYATIPNTVTTLPACLFSGCVNLRTVVWKGGVLSDIPDKMFQSCWSLGQIDITFADSLTIGEYAFQAVRNYNVSGVIARATACGKYAFEECDVTEVTIPRAVTIPVGLFKNCRILRKVTYEGTLTNIPEELFYYCDSLETMNINLENVISVGASAFFYCTELDITIPPTIQSIGSYAFSSCRSVQFTTLNMLQVLDSYALNGIDTVTTFTIPTTMDTLPDGLFSDCKNLVSVTYTGASVTSIPSDFFRGCKSLQTLNMEFGDTIGIGSYAFENCVLFDITPILSKASSLGSNCFTGCGCISVTVPSRIAELTTCYFCNCEKLESFTYARTITSIPEYFFAGCKKLQTLNIQFDNIRSIGSSAFSDCQSLLAIDVSKVTNFGSHCFSNCKSFQTITINADAELSNGMFAGCENLATVTHNKQITEIPQECFKGCISLQTLDMTFTNLESLGYSAFSECGQSAINTIMAYISASTKDVDIGSRCFAYGTFTEITLPSNVKSLSSELFAGCRLLTRCVYNREINEIPMDCFYECYSLTTLTLNIVNLVSIGRSAFEKCYQLPIDSLLATKMGTVNDIGERAFAYTRISEVIIGSGVSTIPSYLFSHCDYLTTASIPDTVTGIGSYVFESCSKLTTVSLPAQLNSMGDGVFLNCPMLSSVTGDLKMFEYMFQNCYNYEVFTAKSNIPGHLFHNSGLKELTVGAEVESIHSYAFSECYRLNKVIFENVCNLKTIGDNAFMDCSSLTTLKLPAQLTSIGYRAFHGCRALTSVEFTSSSSLNSIGEYAFAYSGLTTFSLLTGCSQFGSYVFQNCKLLTEVTLDGPVQSIGQRMFSGCSSLRKVDFGNSFKRFGSGMFQDCYSLTEVTLPEAVESGDYSIFGNSGIQSIVIPSKWKVLYESMFESCVKLSSVTLPNGLESIPSRCFYGCAIKEIQVPDTCTSLGSAAFSNCFLLEKINIPSGVTEFTSNLFYMCRKLNLQIPDTVKIFKDECLCFTAITSFTIHDSPEYEYYGPLLLGTQVKTITIPESWNAIPDGFFSGMAITEFTFPSKVVSIGGSAFSGSALRKITIPNSVTSIGGSTFSNCALLTEVNLPSNLQTIPSSMFYGCRSLKSITIPESVISIGGSVFSRCTSLSEVKLPSGLQSLGSSVFKQCYALRSLTIPASVTSIGISAFSGCDVTITIPESSKMTEIGSYVFTEMEITTFTVPRSVCVIGSNAFYSCKKLNTIVLHDQITTIGERAFANCESLESFSLPSSVTTMETELLSGCTSLSTVTLHSGITLKSRVFMGCTSLVTIQLPGDAIVDENVYCLFQDCTSLTQVTLPNTWTRIPKSCFENCVKLQTFNFPTACMSICDYAFRWCSGLATFTIPNTVEEIRRYAFQGCAGLEEIVIPDTVTTLSWEGLFRDCTKLQRVTLPSSVTSIGSYTFFNCTKMTLSGITAPGVENIEEQYPNGMFGYWDAIETFTVPDNMRSIPDDIFCGCKNLETLTMHQSVQRIGERAFSGCSKLTEINLPASLLSIGAEALAGTGIEQISLPEKIYQIPEGLFSGCTKLTTFTITNKIVTIGSNAFSGCTELRTFAIPEHMSTIPEGMFRGCSKLETVTTSNNLRIVEDYAFQDCTNLHTFEIPSGVRSLGNYVFSNCKAMTSVNIPNGVTSIGMHTFSGTAISDVTLPQSLSSLSEGIFADCNNLKTFTIPEHIQILDSYIFEGCQNLVAVSIATKKLVEWSTGIFKNCPKLVMVNIPEGANYIPSEMFNGCKTLTQIALHDGITGMSRAAFANSGLRSLVLPHTTYSIDDDIIANCTYLKTLTYCGSYIPYTSLYTFRDSEASISVGDNYLGDEMNGIPVSKDATECGGSSAPTKPPEIVMIDKEREEKLDFEGSTVVIADSVASLTVPEVTLGAGAAVVIVGNVVLESTLSLEDGASLSSDSISLAEDGKVEISMKASGTKLPKLSLGEVANGNTPSEIGVSVNGGNMSPEDFQNLASGNVVILSGFGAQFDCEKWNSKIALNVDGDSSYKWATRCRAEGSRDGIKGRASLLEDATAKEIYVTGEEIPSPDDGLSPGAIAGIVIGCVAGVALIAGGVFFFLKKRGITEITVEP